MAAVAKHCGAGSDCPPPPTGLRIYGMRFCPFSERARLVARAKGIPYELIHINLRSKPEWYLERNPTGKTPFIENGDHSVFDSLTITDYLDASFPGKQLNPSEPYQRAKNKMILDLFGKVHSTFHPIFNPNFEGQNPVDWWEAVQKELEFLEKEIASRGSPYFGGDSPMMLDYLLWPWFERFETVPHFEPSLSALSPSRFPSLLALSARLKEDPAIQKEAIDVPSHIAFMKTLAAGTPDFDVGLEN